MISVENFYYVIYTHLLSQNKFQDLFFYPFGSTNLINNGFVYKKYTHNTNQCLLYDQEPILLNIYNSKKNINTSNKFLNILANSEHSKEKSKILKEDFWLDWYYFYHGFAAHDWFRDCPYFVHKYWTKPFISFNRLCTGDRAYRLLLVTEMIENDIADKGFVSLHIKDQLKSELLNSGSWLSGKSKVRIHKAINRDWIIDKPNVLGSASAGVGPEEWTLWQDAFVHVVTETIFYHEKQHLTEKIFKPIVAERPFMLVGAHKNLEYLRGYGFKTFDRWWSEDYDLETDSEKRISMIVGELKKFISQPEWRLREIHQEMKPILEHNRQHFWGEFKTIIVDELVDNFEICLRQWNNGRVDGREVDLSVYNFDQIKKLLSH